MTVTVGELAAWVRGEVLGDADLAISNARALADAEPGDITLVDNDRHMEAWHKSPAAAAVVPMTTSVNGRPVIRVADPLMAFVQIFQQLRGPRTEPAIIDPSASVHPTAQIGEGAAIGPFAVVGDGATIGAGTRVGAGVAVGRGCRIGAGTILYPRVVLYDDCTLGDRVIVQGNVVIGGDGFGYRFHGGAHVKVPQLGWVEIEDDVEIGAGTTIDRGTFGPTRIGKGTKIDNLVMIAHNCRIGRHNIIAAQVGIAGSTTTGDYVVIAGQVGIGDHLTIGDRAVIGAQSGVTKSVPSDSRVMGFPARPEGLAKRSYAVFEHLPELRADLNRIKKHLGLEE
ncbi:MAG TPA: UDP-3-O-(3-hydroxymyristoyl)glucosamine N-acyltransferase [Gemmataceae bacterium]